jgi:hypothetical protein
MSEIPPLCQHVRANGEPCKAISIKGENFCYFHHHSYRRKKELEQLREFGVKDAVGSIEIPAVLEDETSVQAVVTDVLRGISDNTIPERRVWQFLAALQIASANAKSVRAFCVAPALLTRSPTTSPAR